MATQIMHNQVSCNPSTIKKVTSAINDGRLNIEKDIKDFEREIEKYLLVEKGSCIAVSSGSIALLLSLYSLEKKYDEFIIPSYTCKSISSSTFWFVVTVKSPAVALFKLIDFLYRVNL